MQCRYHPQEEYTEFGCAECEREHEATERDAEREGEAQAREMDRRGYWDTRCRVCGRYKRPEEECCS